MRRTISFLILLVTLSGILPLQLSAQERDGTQEEGSSAERYGQFEERLRITPEEYAKLPTVRQLVERYATDEFLAKSASDRGIAMEEEVEAEVHAAVNPTDTNNIVVAPMKITDDGSVFCTIYYTRDFGGTWNRSQFLTLPPDLGAVTVAGGDPMLAFDGDGKLYMSWLNVYLNGEDDSAFFDLSWAWSDDGGVTWEQAERYFAAKEGWPGGYPVGLQRINILHDKQWMTADGSDSEYRNTLYMAYTLYRFTDPVRQRIMFLRKLPNKDVWEEPLELTGEEFNLVQFTSVDVDPEGTVHLTFWGWREGVIGMWYSQSKDGGATLTEPKLIARLVSYGRMYGGAQQDTVHGISRSRMQPSPHSVVDKSGGPAGGNIYVVWAGDGIVERGDNGLDVYSTRSTDNGETWEAPRVLNDDTPGLGLHQFHPSITVNPDGVVIVGWYDRREDVANRETEYYMTWSTDGGETFAGSIPVTTAATDFTTVHKIAGIFGIGEYTQIVSTTGHAIPFWTDGRDGTGNLNIYGAFIPLSPDGTTGVDRVTSVTDAVSLFDPIPNPVSGSEVVLPFHVKHPAHIVLTVTDLAGKTVMIVAEGEYEAGEHKAMIETKSLPNGTYYCRLQSDFGVMTRSIAVMR